MNERDPMDELLRQAFDADQARMFAPPIAAPRIAARVAAQLRARQRVRLAVLGSATLAGLLMLALSLQPAIATLLAALPANLAVDWSANGLTLAAVTIAGAAWLMTMDGGAG